MDAFDLSMPWWHFVLRGTVAYLGLLLLMRLVGKRAFGEMTAFDIVILMMVGSVLRTASLGEDRSVLGPFIVVVTLYALDKLLAFLCARLPWLERRVEGRPSLLVDQGRVLPGALRQHDLSEEALHRALRERGLRCVREADEVRLESNGKISVLKAPGPD